MPRYRLSEQASEDLREISAWIARDRPESAKAVVGKLRDTFGLLAKNPGCGMKCDHLREGMKMFVPSKPAKRYVIFFREGKDGVLEVVTVLDSARDW